MSLVYAATAGDELPGALEIARRAGRSSIAISNGAKDVFGGRIYSFHEFTRFEDALERHRLSSWRIIRVSSLTQNLEMEPELPLQKDHAGLATDDSPKVKIAVQGRSGRLE